MRKNYSLLLTEKIYTAALIGINLYSVVLFFFSLWPKYPAYFFYIFCNFEMICLNNREIILAVLLRHNSKNRHDKES